MKKINFLFLFGLLSVMMFGFSACSDDKDVAIGNSSIVGVWEVADKTINGLKGTLRVEFRANKTGTMTAIYSDGTDSDSYNFEYVLNEGKEGEEYYQELAIIWTGTQYLIYEENIGYDITVSPTRLIWGPYTYTRK